MKKFKAARAKKKTSGMRGAIPCIAFMVLAMALLMLLFYSILKSG